MTKRSLLLFLTMLGIVLLPAVAQAQGDTTTVTLSAQNNSGISGTATLTQMGTDLQVVLNLSGAPAGGIHPAHIHKGSCANLTAAPLHPLQNVVNGKSTTMLTGVKLSDVAGNTAINVHKSAEELTVYVACGDIAKIAGAMAAASPTAGAMTSSTAPQAMPKTGAETLPGLLALGTIVLLAGLALRRRPTV